MIDKTDFMQKLVRLRNECGLSQNRLSSMLCVSPQAVSKWETGMSLPDIDLLPLLAQILGVSVDYLLGNERIPHANDSEAVRKALIGYDIADDNVNILAAMSGKLTRNQLFRCARLVEDQKLSFKLALEAIYNDDDIHNVISEMLDLRDMQFESIAGMSIPLTNLTIRTINKDSNPIKDIVHIFKCPVCEGDFTFYKDGCKEYLSCGKHEYPITDGVADFGTFEQHGNNWSSWVRSYEDYKTKILDINKNTEEVRAIRMKYEKIVYRMIDNIKEFKPSVLLDIGSGMASFVAEAMKFIDWPCTIILTDISHRILKYDKRHFDEIDQNPNVNFVCLACDAGKLPLKNGTIPMVISFGGYENMHRDITLSIGESYRVLADDGNGCLNSSLSMVEDRNAEPTKKWLHLIEIDDDADAPVFLKMIFDLSEWNEHITNIGFKQHSIELINHEAPPPETEKFPYTHEIAQWMADTVITAVK